MAAAATLKVEVHGGVIRELDIKRGDYARCGKKERDPSIYWGLKNARGAYVRLKQKRH